MKATLEFTLPEERAEYELASRSGGICCAVTNHLQWLRTKYKHGDLDEPVELALLEAIANLWEELGSNNVAELFE